MARISKNAPITVVFYKDQELCNKREFPLTGWLYGKGMSLKGVSPVTYDTKEDLVKAIETYRGKVTRLYFNIAEDGNAVETF